MNEILSTDLEKTHKLCPKCNSYKLRSGFHNHKAMSEGLASYCKDCSHDLSSAKYNESVKDPAFREQLKNRPKAKGTIESRP